MDDLFQVNQKWEEPEKGTKGIRHYMTDQKKNLSKNQPWIKATRNEQEKSNSLVVLTPIRNMAKQRWYFDNGCS